jgi:hypothetical protein
MSEKEKKKKKLNVKEDMNSNKGKINDRRGEREPRRQW